MANDPQQNKPNTSGKRQSQPPGESARKRRKRAPDAALGPTPATGPTDIGAEDLGPVTSGDAANIGDRPPTTGSAGGGTLHGNIGDAGADAGEGSIDATDDTTVTGDPDISPAMLSPEDQSRAGSGSGAHLPPSDPATGYRVGGASGALGPEDVDPAAGAPEPDYGPDPTGPDADSEPYGPQSTKPMGTGHGAKPFPTEVGSTNIHGPIDEQRERESPAPKPDPDKIINPPPTP